MFFKSNLNLTLCMAVVLLVGQLLVGCAATPQSPKQAWADPWALADQHELGPGDRIEVTILQPGIENGTRRLRAVIDQTGSVNLPLIGSVHCAGLSRRQLEQALLVSLNNTDTARGTVRLKRAPIVTTGLFVVPRSAQFEKVIATPAQRHDIDQHVHMQWQWVILAESIAKNRALPADTSLGQKRSIGAPLHSQLVGAEFQRAVTGIATDVSPLVQQGHVTFTCAPGAAQAFANALGQHRNQTIVLVIDNRVVALAAGDPLHKNRISLTGGRFDLSVAAQREIVRAFSHEDGKLISAKFD